MGHPEYDRMTLDSEYKRDREKGLAITLPCNYYPDDDPTQRPMLQWRSHGNILYANWLNYYVYQQTPMSLSIPMKSLGNRAAVMGCSFYKGNIRL